MLNSNVSIAQQPSRLPPMGWNNWNCIYGDINDTIVYQTVNAIISSGMKDSGYSYICIDDNWMERERDNLGNLIVNKKKFPNGLKCIADYIHSKGLKFGIYECLGPKTCMGLMGSYGHEKQDFDFFNSLQIDFLKMDRCDLAPGQDNDSSFKLWSNLIKDSGRSIVFYIDGLNTEFKWAGNYANMIRIQGDLSRKFSSKVDWWESNTVMVIDTMANIINYSGPGHWLDGDMMQVGNGMSDIEGQTQFSMWAFMNSSLIAGNDIRKMTPTTRRILTNNEIIALNQDSLAIPGHRIYKNGGIEIWTKPLFDGNSAFALLNLTESDANITINFSSLEFPIKIYVRDLWEHVNKGQFKNSYTAKVFPHGVAIVKLSKNELLTIK